MTWVIFEEKLIRDFSYGDIISLQNVELTEKTTQTPLNLTEYDLID